MKLDIIELQVKNWKSMVEWYEKLGFTVRYREDEHKFALLSADDGAMLGLYGVESKTPSNFTPYIKVEGINKEVQELKNKGIAVDAMEERHWGKQALVTDPEGNTLYLYEEKSND